MNKSILVWSNVVVLTVLLLGGCFESSSESVAGYKTEAEKLPKLDFHKPKNLEGAVTRLREIHDAVVADHPLPEPKKFDVLEVIHGEGANSHSHYYLADSDRKDADDHHHEDMHSEEKQHQIEIDVFTEFQDIAEWLPKIAASTDDIEEETWNSVKQIAGDLTSAANRLIGEQQDIEMIRQSFRESTEIEKLIKQLESETGSNATSDTGGKP